MHGMIVDVPEGVSGDWAVERFAVTPEDAARQRVRSIFSGRHTPVGSYTKLTRNGLIIMSDTPDEMRDHISFRHAARGHVLVNGLGLGMVIEMVIGQVQRITVVEKSEDVISLVAPHYLAKYPDKVEIIHADAYEFGLPKGIRFNAVWHDIWDNMCSDNLPEMTRLHRKYGRRADWQGSWGRYQCEQARARGY